MSEFDPKELERIIRKIKHCLALSQSANEHEAATAMRQAQSLMQKYRLTELDVHLSDIGKSEAEKAAATRPAWEKDLAGLVASAFGCRSFTFRNWCSKRLLVLERSVFVGVSPSHEIAKYAYDTLLTKVTFARKQFMADIRAGRVRPAKYSAETRGNHFALAWVSAVHHKLEALVPETDELTPSESQALIVSQTQENALIDQFMHQLTNGAGVGKSRAGKMAKPNTSDLLAGFQAGGEVELNHGVGTATAQPLAIGRGAPEQGSFL